MRLGIIQPNFIPWRGYFDFIKSVDVFLMLDDVQFTKQDWRSRNRIKTRTGSTWLTVPVKSKGLGMKIKDVEIDEVRGWRRKHSGTWRSSYASAPAYSDIKDLLREMNGSGDSKLLGLNVRLIKAICEYLKIDTPIYFSSDYPVEGVRTERLLGLLKRFGATRYLSGPSADGYLDKQLFLKNNVALEYKAYDYEPYPQLWGAFDGAVSVLDLIANCGEAARGYLKSMTPNHLVVDGSR